MPLALAMNLVDEQRGRTDEVGDRRKVLLPLQHLFPASSESMVTHLGETKHGA